MIALWFLNITRERDRAVSSQFVLWLTCTQVKPYPRNQVPAMEKSTCNQSVGCELSLNTTEIDENSYPIIFLIISRYLKLYLCSRTSMCWSLSLYMCFFVFASVHPVKQYKLFVFFIICVKGQGRKDSFCE